MPPDNQHYTFNEMSNEDKELLLQNGYKPGELSPEDEQELLSDLNEQQADDGDSDGGRESIIADEQDGTD